LFISPPPNPLGECCFIADVKGKQLQSVSAAAQLLDDAVLGDGLTDELGGW